MVSIVQEEITAEHGKSTTKVSMIIRSKIKTKYYIFENCR